VSGSGSFGPCLPPLRSSASCPARTCPVTCRVTRLHARPDANYVGAGVQADVHRVSCPVSAGRLALSSQASTHGLMPTLLGTEVDAGAQGVTYAPLSPGVDARTLSPVVCLCVRACAGTSSAVESDRRWRWSHADGQSLMPSLQYAGGDARAHDLMQALVVRLMHQD
jgi:hypothetical protein